MEYEGPMSNPYPSGPGSGPYPTPPSSNLMGSPHSYTSGSPGGPLQSQHSSPMGLSAHSLQSSMQSSIPGLSSLGGMGSAGGMQQSMQRQLTSSMPQYTTQSSVDQASAQQSLQNRLTPTVPSVQAESQSTPQSSRDMNTASLCRIGQETVQDIISRTQEIFQTLKNFQPPNGCAAGVNIANEKKMKVQEQLRTIRILFKRLRLIYEKCNDNSQLQVMEYTHIESLIPIKDEWDGKSEERKNSESYRLACEEQKELMEAVLNKNKILKDIIDHMRRMIWEINTMLMMRRS